MTDYTSEPRGQITLMALMLTAVGEEGHELRLRFQSLLRSTAFKVFFSNTFRSFKDIFLRFQGYEK